MAEAAERTARKPDVLKWARRYRAYEFSIFPVCTPVPTRPGHCQQHGECPHPGKRPLVAWKQYQVELADEAQIEAWWLRWPDANIGMATGQLSDVVVVDLDGEVAQAEAARLGYDEGPWLTTGRVGGRHLWFRWRPDAPQNFAKRGGIDFRTEGGFVLLPPSLHYSGVRYCWGQPVQSGEPLPDLPRWVDDMAHTSSAGEPRNRVAVDQIFFEGLPEGQRDQELFRLAAKLRGAGIPYEIASEMLLKAASLCRPPFPDDQALAKVDSAYERYQPNAEAGRSDDDIIDSVDLLSTELPEPRWAIPGIFPQGVVLLVGKSKLGKSWLILDVAKGISSGTTVWGQIAVEKGEVLYLALEDSKRRLQDRIRALWGDDHPERGLYLVTRWPRADEGGIPKVLDWLDKHPNARMVIIDVLLKFRPKESNKNSLYRQDYEALAPLAEVARVRGLCVVVVHHANKLNPEDPIDSISGTTGLPGAADAIAMFRRERGKADASLLITGRDVEEQELAFRRALNDGTGTAWQIIGEAEEVRLSQEQQQVLELVTESPGLKPVDIAGAMGISSNTMRQRLFSMVRTGKIRLLDGGYHPPFVIPANTPNAPNAPNARVAEGIPASTPNTPNAFSAPVQKSVRGAYSLLLTPNGTAPDPTPPVTPVRGVRGISPISPIMPISPVTGNDKNGAVGPACDGCGQPGGMMIGRYRLHNDCSVRIDG